jgi:hypothetical protein
MERVQVIILDRDQQYRSTLSDLLARMIPSVVFCDPSAFESPDRDLSFTESMATEDRVDISVCGFPFDQSILLYNPAEFENPPPLSHSIVLTDLRPDAGNESPKGSIYRYASSCDFVLLLEEYLQENPSLTEKRYPRNVWCIAGQTCGLGRSEAILELAAAKLRDGFVPVLLEIAPRHERLFRSEYPDDGRSLSDAMLRLMADDLTFDELGTYMTPQESGMLTFRAFECTDDLFECSPEDIRRLVALLRQWNEFTAWSHFILIICCGVPFSFIYKASILCDQLMILNRAGDRFNASEFNRELSALISNLPDSCSVQINDIPCHASCGGHSDAAV